MRLFKGNQPFQSEEDRARDARLTHIASRYRPRPSFDGPEPSIDPDSGAAPDVPPELPLDDSPSEPPQ